MIDYKVSTVSQEEQFDLMNENYSFYSDCKNAILQNYLIDFGLFYQNDLKYRKVAFEIKEQQTKQCPPLPNYEGLANEVKENMYRDYHKNCGKLNKSIVEKICKRENFNIEKHRGDRVFYTMNYAFWMSLLNTSKLTLSEASAFISELDLKLKEHEMVFQSPKDLLSIEGKRFDELTVYEERAINHNSKIAIGLPQFTAYQRQQLQIFIDSYKYITPDIKVISMLKQQEINKNLQDNKQVKNANSKLNNSFGFYLGLTDDKLKHLHQKLIENDFLDSNADKNHFVNAFNGKELIDFDKIEWIDKAERVKFVSIQTLFQLLHNSNIELRNENKVIKKEVKDALNAIFSNSWGNINSKYNDFEPLNTERHKLISSIIESLKS